MDLLSRCGCFSLLRVIGSSQHIAALGLRLRRGATPRTSGLQSELGIRRLQLWTWSESCQQFRGCPFGLMTGSRRSRRRSRRRWRPLHLPGLAQSPGLARLTPILVWGLARGLVWLVRGLVWELLVRGMVWGRAAVGGAHSEQQTPQRGVQGPRTVTKDLLHVSAPKGFPPYKSIQELPKLAKLDSKWPGLGRM